MRKMLQEAVRSIRAHGHKPAPSPHVVLIRRMVWIVVFITCLSFQAQEHKIGVIRINDNSTPAQIEQWRHAYDMETEINALAVQRKCKPVSVWPKGQYPKTMVVQLTQGMLPTWTVVDKPWSFKDVGGYVKELCAR